MEYNRDQILVYLTHSYPELSGKVIVTLALGSSSYAASLPSHELQQVVEAVIASVVLFSTRYMLGYAYNNEKEVVDYVKGMIPLIWLSVFMDDLHGVLSGKQRKRTSSQGMLWGSNY